MALQLQINNSGAWKTLMRFAEARVGEVMDHVSALYANDFTAHAQRPKLRIATGDPVPKALQYFESRPDQKHYAWRSACRL